MRTHAAFIRQGPATARARMLQQRAERSHLFGVEFDAWKEPYAYRVVSFDLNDARDRARIAPVGAQMVDRVYVVMWARRLEHVLAVPKPKQVDYIGEYKARRAAKRRARRAA